MGGIWQKSVRDLLRDLEATQRDLSTLQDRKRTALVQGHSEQLVAIAREETTLSHRLRGLLQRRTEILDDARKSGMTRVSSLTSLVAQLEPDVRSDLEPLLDHARQRAKNIRRETWVQWIIAHRAYSHYSSLLELVAQSGRQSPTYDSQPSKDSTGGAIFDASI